MVLYWYTDKKIAGKHLKKPIPVTIEQPYDRHVNLRMFNMTLAWEEKYDYITIQAFSRQIKGECDYKMLGEEVKKIHDEFNEHIKEYLE